MSFPKSKQPEASVPLPKPPHLILQQAFTDLQSHCSAFFQRHHNNHLHHHHHHHVLFNVSLFKPNPFSFKNNFESTFSNLFNQTKRAIEAGVSKLPFGPSSASSGKNPAWARIAENVSSRGLAMSTEAIEERLAGVPVYALANSSEEFVLVSGVRSGKSLALFCFKEDDAETLLEQMKSMDPSMREGSKVVTLALNKVFQLKLDDVAFRLVPESTQIKNALEVIHTEKQNAGSLDESFLGIPVFQWPVKFKPKNGFAEDGVHIVNGLNRQLNAVSRSLMLRSEDKRYRPVFFRKEDLDYSLLLASRQKKKLNPSFREGDVQVAVLEDIIRGMKDSTTSMWDDVVFIPPGFDVSNNIRK